MRATFEKVTPSEGSSWAFQHRQLPDGIPFWWHYHPEYELTLTTNSRGYRYVGGNIDTYDDGDLVLVGPCLPHAWCSSESLDEQEPYVALVIKFTEQWIRDLMVLLPELAGIDALLAASTRGVFFSASTRVRTRPLLEAMSAAEPPQRLVLLLQILLELCHDQEASVMANVPASEAAPQGIDPRILRVLDHLHLHYTEPQTAPDLAELACLSVSALHRLFRKHTRVTLIEYIVQLRIGKACSLLMQSDRAIGLIAAESGYANLALFNRQFAKLKGESPSQFRKRHRRIVGRDD